MNKTKVHIIGAGLAGCEAAHVLTRQGIPVVLHEMRPKKMTEAHKTGGFAELVCSNSLKSKSKVAASGILKEELRLLNSLIIESAETNQVPGGDALSVDRETFSQTITAAMQSNPLVEISYEELGEPPSDRNPCIIATGPLTSSGLTDWLEKATGEKDLYFYDAIAPIIDAESIDRSKCFLANRYGKGEEQAYINCPLSKEEYEIFIHELKNGENVPTKPFEKQKFYQGCQPIEVIAETGDESLRYGPMKPVGLVDPNTGEQAHAVVQLRPENLSNTAYNMVGFQTKLKYGEQIRIFKLIPALANAEFLRLGSIHRNTYVCSPRVLRPDLSLKGHPQVYLAGQITGVEGYLESAACGHLAGLFVGQRLREKKHYPPPPNTALGSLLRYIITQEPKKFQPTSIHFGIFEQSFFDNVVGKKREFARQAMSDQALANIRKYSQNDTKLARI